MTNRTRTLVIEKEMPTRRKKSGALSPKAR